MNKKNTFKSNFFLPEYYEDIWTTDIFAGPIKKSVFDGRLLQVALANPNEPTDFKYTQ